ncbi:MAG TPA: hypothetical protein VG754_02630 [Verrucomicrobiae bacterium]|nr:hypothetical protein [Verrucomicrobiae bacterium]
MKHSVAIVVLIASLLLGLAMNSRAQTYSINWYKVAGGGGTSTTGSYALSGTIGQPDAGTMSGGAYTLTGGFWGLIATVQIAGAPFLSLWTTNSHNAVLSWPASATGFHLQQDPSLGNTNWSSVNTNTYPINLSNGTNYVTLPISGANQFFRLSNP